MSAVEISNDIKGLFRTYKLGNIIEEPVSISGGLMHKTYKVTTEKNIYALKWLNPSIMQRNDVLENMINSERIANALSNYLSVVAAINFNNHNVLHWSDNYYMVFHWLEGSSIYPPYISEQNCYEIGNALGKIHQLNISVPGIVKEKVDSTTYDWEQYGKICSEQNASWLDNYTDKIEKLIIWNQRANDANIKLSEYSVISHRDLDPKNVMWNNDTPYFIDWEAAGYINPYQELLEVLNYWSVDDNGNLDNNKFKILLNAYSKYISFDTVNWNCVLDSGYAGMLGWLEYSLKRALGLESADKDEISLGAEQIIGTIKALEKYDSQKTLMKKWICD